MSQRPVMRHCDTSLLWECRCRVRVGNTEVTRSGLSQRLSSPCNTSSNIRPGDSNPPGLFFGRIGYTLTTPCARLRHPEHAHDTLSTLTTPCARLRHPEHAHDTIEHAHDTRYDTLNTLTTPEHAHDTLRTLTTPCARLRHPEHAHDTIEHAHDTLRTLTTP